MISPEPLYHTGLNPHESDAYFSSDCAVSTDHGILVIIHCTEIGFFYSLVLSHAYILKTQCYCLDLQTALGRHFHQNKNFLIVL